MFYDIMLSRTSAKDDPKHQSHDESVGRKPGALCLKENIIIGKLIPAGTGMKCYRDIFPVKNKDYVGDDNDDMIPEEKTLEEREEEINLDIAD